MEQRGHGRVTVRGSKVSAHTVGNQPNREHPGINSRWSMGSLTLLARGELRHPQHPGSFSMGILGFQ